MNTKIIWHEIKDLELLFELRLTSILKQFFIFINNQYLLLRLLNKSYKLRGRILIQQQEDKEVYSTLNKKYTLL